MVAGTLPFVAMYMSPRTYWTDSRVSPDLQPLYTKLAEQILHILRNCAFERDRLACDRMDESKIGSVQSLSCKFQLLQKLRVLSGTAAIDRIAEQRVAD